MADPLDYESRRYELASPLPAVIFSIYVAPWICGCLLLAILMPPIMEPKTSSFFSGNGFPIACIILASATSLTAAVVSVALIHKGARKYRWNCVLNCMFFLAFSTLLI